MYEEVDAWSFSEHELAIRMDVFLRAYGLTGKTDGEIEAYCERHRINPPNFPPLYAPTLKQGDRVKVRGKFANRCTFCIFWDMVLYLKKEAVPEEGKGETNAEKVPTVGKDG